MSRLKMVLSLTLVVGCSESGSTAPPWGVPITGGTLLVTRDGQQAVVADPDRDRIVAIQLATGTVTGELALTAGDEPGRLIEDGAGRIHVALRRGGAVVTLTDGITAQVAARRFACTEPRGLAWDAATDAIHVACAGGELVTFAAAGGEATRVLRLDRDLRDVIVAGANLVVSRFRTAELLTIDAAGTVVDRQVPPTVQRFGGFGDGGVPPEPAPAPDDMGTGGGRSSQPGGVVDAPPSTAWRSIALADGRIVLTHQRQVKRQLGTQQEGGYGGDCGGSPVEAAITVVHPGQPPQAVGRIASGALPVDLAASADGSKLALVVAGQKTVTVVDTSIVFGRSDQEDCGPKEEDDGDKDDDNGDDLGAPTSVAFTPSGDLVVFYPEHPALVVRTAAGTTARTIKLTGSRGGDAGRAVFHTQTKIGLACASCHPEGRDDGQVWDFAELGKRRTQSLAGHILERAPYHWAGDMATLDVLMDDVFAVRMAGGPLTNAQKHALGPWIDRIPAPPSLATADAATIERGKTLFEAAEVGCVSCHNGDLRTNNRLVNVGTGAAFKVPSLLGVASRGPFLHDGCAPTLLDRFGACGGGDLHGHTSQLAPAQLADLVAYLESL